MLNLKLTICVCEKIRRSTKKIIPIVYSVPGANKVVPFLHLVEVLEGLQMSDVIDVRLFSNTRVL